MLGRRGFLKAIGAAVLGMSLALRAPEEMPDCAPDEPVTESISGRFMQHFSIDTAAHPTRVDIIYGWRG